MIKKWESKILRKMYGAVTKERVLIRTNLASNEFYKTPDLIATLFDWRG
jgi:hypothetical protein